MKIVICAILSIVFAILSNYTFDNPYIVPHTYDGIIESVKSAGDGYIYTYGLYDGRSYNLYSTEVKTLFSTEKLRILPIRLETGQWIIFKSIYLPMFSLLAAFILAAYSLVSLYREWRKVK